MLGLLKTVGKGLLYIIGLPFFLLVLAIYAVFGLFLLIFMFIKSIIFFFTGRSLDDELPEDIEARHIKEGPRPSATQAEPVQEQPVPQSNQPEDTNTYQVGIESAIFGPYVVPNSSPVIEEQEPKEELEQGVEEPVFETPVYNNPSMEPISQATIEEEEKPIKHTQENIGQYVPHTDNSRFINEEEEEEESGVTITFGDDDE